MESVRTLYKQMGDVFEAAPSWSKYIVTSDLEFEKYYGKKATRKRKLYNGAIRTDYYQYWANAR
jgi:putative N6-adenine-specific DNA methylase